MFNLPATSALVLLWENRQNYTSDLSNKYLNLLNLDSGTDLFNRYNKLCPYYQEIIVNRKFIIQKLIDTSIKESSMDQVVILASGLAPLSIEIAIRHPSIKIFETDLEFMKIKKDFYKKIDPNNKQLKNISFSEVDLSQPNLLSQHLQKETWDPNKKHSLL